MLKKAYRVLAGAAVLAGLALATACVDPGPRMTASTAYKWKKMHVWYVGTNGKVGHNMYAEPRGKCPASWQSHGARLYGGTLPPGLRLRGTRIEGVPTTPGRYHVRVRINDVRCQGVKQGDRLVNVYFYITGVAAQRLD